MNDMSKDEELTGSAPADAGADVIGPGTGGTPTAAGTGGRIDRDEAASDPEVAALIEDLRADADGDVRVSASEAAEEVGTGTDH